MNQETEHNRCMAELDYQLNFLPEQEAAAADVAIADYRGGSCSKIRCIRRMQAATNWDLKESKDYVEWRVPKPGVKCVTPHFGTLDDVTNEEAASWQQSADFAALNKQLEDRIKLLESDLETERSAHSESRNELYTEQDRNAVLRERVRCLASALRELISVVAED